MELAELTAANRERVAALAVGLDQRRFLSTPDLGPFLADADLHLAFKVLAISEEGAICGLVSFGRISEDRTRWWVSLSVIDHEYQGRGIGRAAMLAVIEQVRHKSAGGLLGLSFHPENEAARRLYTSLGFEAEEELSDEGEVVARLRL